MNRVGIETPKNWNLQKLEDICNSIRDGTHTPPPRTQTGLPMLSARNIYDGRINWDKGFSFISKRDFEKIERTNPIKENDVLLTIVGTLGKCCVVKEKTNFTVQRSVAIFRPNKNMVISEYLHYYFSAQKFQNLLIRFANTTAQSGIYLGILKRMLISIPPVVEQQAISSVLSNVDDIIHQTKQLIDNLKLLKRGLMQQLFTQGIGHTEFKETKIGRIPEEWEINRIGRISEVRRGASPRPIRDPKYFAEKGRGWIRISDVTASFKYLTRTTQYLSDLGVSKSVIVNPGDLIMSICATIGKPIILDMKACIHDGFVLFKNVKPEVKLEFLFYLLQNWENKFKDMKQMGTQGNLNTSIVKNFRIPVPSLQEQKKISLVLSNIDSNLKNESDKLKQTKQAKKALMQDLLTGKIKAPIAQTN